MTIVQVLTVIGSFIGACTGVAYFWEKVVKERPIAFIHSKPSDSNGHQRNCSLKIINRSRWPILISWKPEDNEDFKLATGRSRTEILQMQYNERPSLKRDGKPGPIMYLLIDGEQEADIALFLKDEYNEKTLQVKVKWQYFQTTCWPLPRHLKGNIKWKNYLQLINKMDGDNI